MEFLIFVDFLANNSLFFGAFGFLNFLCVDFAALVRNLWEFVLFGDKFCNFDSEFYNFDVFTAKFCNFDPEFAEINAFFNVKLAILAQNL
jgi:hypothetical protein